MSALLSGGIQAPVVATLVFSVASALLAVAAAGQPASIRKTGVSAMATALLAVLVVLRNGHPLLEGALLLAAVGEMLLVQDRLPAYLAALGVQLAVRVVYGTLFLLASQPQLLAGWRSAVAVGVAAGASWLLVLVVPRAGPLRWPALIHGLLVVAMCALAAAVRPPWVLLGALLLAASDAAMAADRFLRSRSKETPLSTIRLTFVARYLGQALIVLAGLALI